MTLPAARTIAPSLAPVPTCTQLALGFVKIGVSGFGGVLPIARHIIVEERKWLDDRGFTEMLSVGQLLPGPNIVNVAVMLGTRFHGIRGALATFLGLMLPPFLVFVALAAVYTEIVQVAWIKKAFLGVAAVAAGQILAVGIRLGRACPRRWWAAVLGAAACSGILALHVPLPLVVVALAPFGIWFAWQAQASK